VTSVSIADNKAGKAIPVGSGPEAIAITPNGSTAYVLNTFSNTVTLEEAAQGTYGPTPLPCDPQCQGTMRSANRASTSRSQRSSAGACCWSPLLRIRTMPYLVKDGGGAVVDRRRPEQDPGEVRRRVTGR
jgi:hypothetical protein